MWLVFSLITGSRQGKSCSQPHQTEVLCSLWHSTSGNIALGLLKGRSIITVSWVRQFPVTSHKPARTKLLLSSCQDVSQTETSEHLAKDSTARELLLELPLGAPHFTMCLFFKDYCSQQTAVSRCLNSFYKCERLCFKPQLFLRPTRGYKVVYELIMVFARWQRILTILRN